MPMKTGWRSRGYLPHIEAGTTPQFLTWRLADSLPTNVLQAWFQELQQIPERDRRQETLRRIEAYLDAGHGSCVLKNPVAARIVQNALLFHHEKQYRLLAWVVMPNHCHALLVPKDGFSLSKIMHAQKSFTAHEITRALSLECTLWQAEYYDEVRSDEESIERTRHYIEWNPVKAGLCSDPKCWPYSSGHPALRESLGAR
jgi:REP element-mobilizing transposase RayT